MTSANPHILAKFRAALTELYGERIERVILYGSRARGDAQDDSDYDVAVFLENMVDRWGEIDKLIEIELGILDATGAVINALPFKSGSYNERTPLMHEIKREGCDL